MTVQELINELNKIDDKSKLVYHFDRHSVDKIIEFGNDIVLC